MLPQDVDALGNTDYLYISRDACRTNHNRIFLDSDITMYDGVLECHSQFTNQIMFLFHAWGIYCTQNANARLYRFFYPL